MENKNKLLIELIIFVFIALMMIVVVSIYADWRCEIRMNKNYGEYCEAEGMELVSVVLYPDNNSVKIRCKSGESDIFGELFLKNFTV